MASPTSNKLINRFLIGLLLILLILPAIQAGFSLVKTKELGGYAERAPHPELDWSGLLDSSYQPALEKYVEDRISFREILICLRNQVAYSLFRVCKANNIIVGKDEVLFEEGYITSYLGQGLQGEDVIRMNVRKLKAVQDTLARRGILLVFAIVPDKANYFTEYHSERFRQQPRSQSNYIAYAQQMQQRYINLINIAQVFKQWKDTVSYPLFPRGGIHWSGYGITLAANMLFSYIEQRGQLDLPDFKAVGRTITNEPRATDNDIARSLNLPWAPAAFQMAYLVVKFKKPKPEQQKPNMLLVGDSFGWGLITFYPYLAKLFSEKTQFWYYNNQVQVGVRDDMPPGREEYLLDRKAEMLAQKVILVLYNQRNLATFDNGFSAVAYNMFFPLTDADQARIQVIERRLNQFPDIQDKLWKQTHGTNQDYNQLLHTMAVAEYELQQP